MTVTANLGRVQPIYRGAYNPATAYRPLDFVKQAGVTYFCIAPTTGNAPPNASFWEVLVDEAAYLRTGNNLSDLPNAVTALENLGVTATAAQINEGLMQPGHVFYHAGKTPPAGSLKANAAAVSRSAYSDLDAAIYCGDELNATAAFGYRCTDPLNPSTSRSTTGTHIVLPDGRSEFIRGWDDGRGIDVGRVFGSAQSADIGPHTHPGSSYAEITGVNSGQGLRTDNNGNFIGTTAIATSTGTETRPRNVAHLACIKY
jgi:phage-related tail fiber protein